MSQPQPLHHLRVTAVRPVTPRMRRVTLGAPSLDGFALAGPDQQVKLFFPRPGQAEPVLPAPEPDGDVMRWYGAYAALPEEERPWMRSYTLRAHDPAAGTVDVDFFLHEEGEDAGPATRWARSARPGDTLGMFGPSAAFAVPVDPGAGDWTLLYADACALPALATVVAALPPGHRALAYVQVPDAAEEQPLPTAGDLTVRHLRDGDSPVEAVRADDLPTGRPYAWLAGEASAVRGLRRHLVEERGVDRRSVHFTGYWRRRLTQDDAPTPEDLAEARERLSQA
ncbi:siderophore-interacting protein [Streptomyces sp. TLI_105]|uniref:siderophore-interacting protein n=1 Tax=Streptomyces sp. TLI_105 TaxID=1881019 RepID=UPI0008995032|nr:siderophore-interacting protein [Streptomyces sp. TLI_105]SED95356.1 NADPH-dependent ferric siderophore reductase, contains FAD-binding and SIP domains [Streptomyces sp. TLI_105]